LAFLLGAVAAWMLIQAGRSGAPAQAQVTASGGGGNVFAIAGQLSRDVYGLYLVDLEHATICVYEYLPAGTGSSRLRLMAARTFAFDRQLDEYNTEPLPREIKTLVEQHRRLQASRPSP